MAREKLLMHLERGDRGIRVVLGLFVVLALVYGWVNPILESPDAIWHFQYILYLARGKGLPHYTGTPLPMYQEASQPPLYYLLAVPLVSPVDFSDAGEVLQRNPHAAIGVPLHYGNKNVLIHRPDERFVFRGTILAVRLVRFLSTCLGALTVWFTYRAARGLFAGDALLPLIAAAVVAFNPQFIFLSASVNNDNLVTTLAAIAFYLSIQAWQGFPDDRRAALMGVVLGLAAITKLNGLVLVLVVGLLLLAAVWKHRAWGRVVRLGGIIGIMMALTAGWWYGRNLFLYGDPTGLKVMFALFHRRERPPNMEELLYLFEGVRKSFWAVFGWFNVVVDSWVYTALDWWMLVGLVGFVLFVLGLLLRREGRRAVLWLAVGGWAGIYLIALWKWAQMRYPQGRMLFPALPAFALLWVRGWTALLPGRWGRSWVMASVAALCLLACFVPFGCIWPAYAGPPLLEEEQVPSSLHKLNWVYGGSLKLVGVEIYPEFVKPGELLHVRACWQLLKPMDRNYSVFVHVWGRGGVVPGGDIPVQVDTFPGLGAWPTRYIPPGKVVCDEYPLRIPADMEAPTRLTVEMGVYDFSVPGHPGLQPVDEHGNLVPIGVVGYVALVPERWPALPAGINPLDYRFDDGIKLVGFSLEGDVLRLYWRAERRPSRDYTVFVHVVDSQGRWVAGFDGMPVERNFPTSLWPPEALIEDERKLDFSGLGPGEYALKVGLYVLETGERIPVRGSEGILPDGAVTLTKIHVP